MVQELQPDTLLKLYNQVLDGVASSQAPAMPPLPPMAKETYSLDISTDSLTSAEAARDRLVGFKPLQGWVSFQSANHLIDERGVPDTDERTGLLLAAEAWDADGRSLHIRYNGAGGWQVSTYQSSVNGSYLADILTQVAHKVPLGNYLRYRRFWRIDPDHGAQVEAACFIGFGDDR